MFYKLYSEKNSPGAEKYLVRVIVINLSELRFHLNLQSTRT